MIEVVSLMLVLSLGYLLLGVVFALVFVFKGVQKLDPDARQGSRGFRLIIIPGCALFWPILLRRWMRGTSTPEEYSRHRSSVHQG